MLAHLKHELLLGLFSWSSGLHERNVAADALALDVVGDADDRGLSDETVRHERALDLGRADAVARRAEYIYSNNQPETESVPSHATARVSESHGVPSMRPVMK